MSNVAVPGAKALRPRARIMRTLGEELISSETVAILELVKNSYDADAGYALVRFEKSLDAGAGALCVEDDGHGMTLQTVEGSWMEPATSYKKEGKHSKYLKRRFLGEKGVGRFAASRLADELELSTRAAENSQEVYAIFDWTQFDDESLYLDQVLILAENRAPQEMVKGRQQPDSHPSGNPALPRDGSHGTLLRMSGLKRSWTARELNDLRRGLSRLISPFQEERDFRIFLQLPGQPIGSAQELEAPELIKYPHYTLTGKVSPEGEYFFAVTLHASGVSHEFKGWFERPSPAADVTETLGPPKPETQIACGAIDFRILIWDRDQLDNIHQKLGTGIRSIRTDLDSIAGISIYRDGFRVLPYGEPENDWLKLDLRRVQNPTLRLSNNQLTGYIKIGADTNPLLKDQSNREGLDNNRAYADLQSVMRSALSKLESLRFSEKRASQAGKKDAYTSSILEAPDTSALRSRLTQLGSDQETLDILDETTKSWASQIVRIREVLARYHTLATLGQLVDKVVHDGRQPLSTIQGQSTLILEAIERAQKRPNLEAVQIDLKSVHERASKVKDAAGLIDLLLRRIEPLGGRRKGRASKVYLNEIIRNAFAHFDHDVASEGIKVTIPSSNDLVQVDALELQEVLINLIANSIYWLQQVPRDRRSIVVQCSRPTPGEVDIVFADSGPGVSRSNRSAVFEPYFSTKPDGVGLGLVIAGEIIKDYYEGDLELLDSGPLPGAVFRIKLRKRV